MLNLMSDCSLAALVAVGRVEHMQGGPFAKLRPLLDVALNLQIRLRLCRPGVVEYSI